MDGQFTIEEINLMCIFDTGSRDSLIAELTAAVPEFDEPELIEIAENVLTILKAMNDDDYNALDLYPVYDDYDEETEV